MIIRTQSSMIKVDEWDAIYEHSDVEKTMDEYEHIYYIGDPEVRVLSIYKKDILDAEIYRSRSAENVRKVYEAINPFDDYIDIPAILKKLNIVEEN